MKHNSHPTEKTTLTIGRVKDCIEGYDISSQALRGMCDCWYGIAKKEGKSDEEAARIALDNLGDTLLKATNQE